MGKRILHEETRIVTTFIVVDDNEPNDIVGKVTVGPQNLKDDPCILKRVNETRLKDYLAFLELAKAKILENIEAGSAESVVEEAPKLQNSGVEID